MTKIKIEFAEGCFDDFEGTQEELQEIIDQINAMAESGELFENFEPISEEEEKEILECLEKRIPRQ
jgi:thioredoxin-like negative regulator of GroEL